MNIRMNVERRKPMRSSNKPYKNTEATITTWRLHRIPSKNLSGPISPLARTNRLKEIKSKAIINGRKPGPGFLRVPRFSIIPPTAKNTPTASQKRLPTTSGPIRFIETSKGSNQQASHLLRLSLSSPTGEGFGVSTPKRLHRDKVRGRALQAYLELDLSSI